MLWISSLKTQDEKPAIKFYLVILVLVAVLPLLLFGSSVAWLVIEQKKAEFYAELLNIAQTTMVVVDRELESQLFAMDVLSADKNIDTGNLSIFTGRASTLLKSGDWLNVVLIDPRSHIIVASVLARTTPAPTTVFPKEVDEVTKTRKSMIVGVFTRGRTMDAPSILLLQPVIRNNQVRYILAVLMNPTHLNAVFAEQKLAASWTGAILDQHLNIAGLSRDSERYLGIRATPSLVSHINASRKGMFSARNQEGDNIYSVFIRSSITGWSVVIGVPMNEVEEPIRRNLMQLALAGGLLIVLALIMAAIVGHGILRRHNEYERKMFESSSRLDMALSGADMVTWDWNIQDGQILIDSRGSQLLRCAPEALPTQIDVWKQRIFPEDLPEVLAQLNRYFGGITPVYESEYRVYRNDGSWLCLFIRGKIFERDEQNNPVRMLGTVLDITERKVVRDQLRKLSQAVEGSLSGIIITDAEGVIQYINPSFTNTSGYREMEALGQTPRILKSGEHDVHFYKKLWQTIIGGDVWYGQLVNKKSDGDLYWAQASISPIKDFSKENRPIIGYVGILDDITEKRQTLARLQLSQERCRLAFVHAPVGIAVVSQDAALREVNPAFCRMVGYGEEDLLDKSISHFLVKPLNLNSVQLHSPRNENNATITFDSLIIHKDGQTIPVNILLSVMHDVSDISANYIVQIEDISRRKQSQQDDLATGILAAQELDRAKLSYELHDEIGQSLTALKITLKRAELVTDDQATTKACLETGQQIIASMMDEVRSLAYRLRPAEIDQLGLVAALRSYIDKTVRHLGCEVEFLENLGATSFEKNLEICCFRVIQEALTNVLRHANATHIDVSLMLEQSKLTLSVKDNGRGFDTSQYFSSLEKNKSLGIIAMRERIVGNHGQLLINSKPGDGTEIIAAFDLERGAS